MRERLHPAILRVVRSGDSWVQWKQKRGEMAMSRKTIKFVVYIMLFSMLIMTFLAGISSFI
ncbi:MAG TPA: stressosome-associated protein Prli42 [Bacillales bacterium]|nr:stressosome-associated protein Prli42 [Bacillales bacterium]